MVQPPYIIWSFERFFVKGSFFLTAKQIKDSNATDQGSIANEMHVEIGFWQ